MQFRHLAALSAIVSLGALAPAGLQAQGRPARQAQQVVTAVVPSIVRVVADPVARNADGSPLLRVITNDPAIRARYGAGVPTVVVRRGDAAADLTIHAKGGSDLEPEAGVEVRRSTIVAP
ncbi:MAG TPA: hypothetical protein VG940_01055 [Gemmatimonadales bacterium]|nr:hypothetical protein [Gemmatimonadales bacterium]